MFNLKILLALVLCFSIMFTDCYAEEEPKENTKTRELSSTEATLFLSGVFLFHEAINYGSAYIAYKNKTGAPYYVNAGFYSTIGLIAGPESLIASSVFLAQGLYNSLYLLRKDTNASKTRVYVENMIYYHVVFLSAGLYKLLTGKDEDKAKEKNKNLAFNVGYMPKGITFQFYLIF